MWKDMATYILKHLEPVDFDGKWAGLPICQNEADSLHCRRIKSHVGKQSSAEGWLQFVE